MFCYLIILFAATTVTFAGPIVEASNALADLENSIDMSQSNVVKRSDLDSSGVDVDQGSGDTPQSSTSPNFLQDDRNIANPIIDPIDSIESSSFPQNDLVLANSMSASSLSSACTSDASAKELLEDTTVQKRAFKICPSDFKQTGQHHSGTQEVVPLLLPKPTRETHENPCRHTRKPFWVMCGGPMIGYAVGYADYVLNCVPEFSDFIYTHPYFDNTRDLSPYCCQTYHNQPKFYMGYRCIQQEFPLKVHKRWSRRYFFKVLEQAGAEYELRGFK